MQLHSLPQFVPTIRSRPVQPAALFFPTSLNQRRHYTFSPLPTSHNHKRGSITFKPFYQRIHTTALNMSMEKINTEKACPPAGPYVSSPPDKFPPLTPLTSTDPSNPRSYTNNPLRLRPDPLRLDLHTDNRQHSGQDPMLHPEPRSYSPRRRILIETCGENDGVPRRYAEFRGDERGV